MENEDYLPSFDKAEMLAEALGINDDGEEKYLEFLSAAKPLKGFKLVKVEDDEADAEEEEQAVSTTMPLMANPGLAIPRLPFNSPGAHINRLIAAKGFSKEQEKKVSATVVEMVEQLLALIEPQREKRKEL